MMSVRVRLWMAPPPARAGAEYNFKRTVFLRDIQYELCGLFRRRFPSMMASVRTENKTYDSFGDQPFIECSDGDNIEVIFSDTSDPFFFDLEDRRAPKITIEDEIEWDRQIAADETTMSLTEWVRSRRALPPPPADEWELPAFDFPVSTCPPPDFSALFKKAE